MRDWLRTSYLVVLNMHGRCAWLLLAVNRLMWPCSRLCSICGCLVETTNCRLCVCVLMWHVVVVWFVETENVQTVYCLCGMLLMSAALILICCLSLQLELIKCLHSQPIICSMNMSQLHCMLALSVSHTARLVQVCKSSASVY